MKKTGRFFVCEDCKSILEMVEGDQEISVECCGGTLKEIKPNSSEGAGEKHVPEVEIQGNIATVKVGSILHPMTAEHYIGWVSVFTDQGVYRKALKAGGEPIVKFLLSDGEQISAVYAYCNEHGLWEKE